MEFKLAGKKFDPRTAIPIQIMVSHFLDKFPVGETISNNELAKKLGRSHDELGRNATKCHEYCMRFPAPTGTLWGNPKTIAAMNKQLQDEGYIAS